MFTTSDREIFSYKVGAKTIYADPDVLHRRMRRHLHGPQGGLELQAAFRSAFGAEGFTPAPEEQDAAVNVLVELAEVTLGQKRLSDDGQGMTEAELMEAFTAFINFVAESKKKAESLQNCSPTAGGQTDSATPTCLP